MKLITKAIRAQLLKAGHEARTQDKSQMDSPTVKFFNPCGAATWFITDAEEVDNGQDDLRMFGLCDLGMGPGCTELGYVMLSELESIKLMGGALGIERDLYWSGQTLEEVVATYKATGQM